MTYEIHTERCELRNKFYVFGSHQYELVKSPPVQTVNCRTDCQIDYTDDAKQN